MDSTTIIFLIAFFGLGIIIYGVFFQKTENKEIKESFPTKNTLRDNMKKISDGGLSTTPNENLSKFLENGLFGHAGKRKLNELSNNSKDADYIAKAVNRKVLPKDDEIILSAEMERKMSEEFANASWAWLIPAAVSFSKTGKMRLNFLTLYYLSSKLKPVVLSDGTIRVVNMLELDESINITLDTGTPFLVKNKNTGIVRSITKEMLKGMIIDGSIDEILEKAKNFDFLKKEFNEKYEPLKKNHEQLTEMVKTTMESNKKELKKEKDTVRENIAIIEKLVSEKNALQEEIEKLKKGKNEQLEKEVFQEKAISAIPDNNEVNIVSIKNDREKANNSDCSRNAFFKVLLNLVQDNVHTELKQQLVNSIGLLAITKGKSENEVVLFFEEDIFAAYLKKWADGFNCDNVNFKLRTSERYISKESDSNIFLGRVTLVVLTSTVLSISRKIFVTTEHFLKNTEDDNIEVKRAREQIANGETKSVMELLDGRFL